MNKIIKFYILFLLSLLIVGCGPSVKFYSWPAYLGKDTERDFKNRTGVRINYQMFGDLNQAEESLLNNISYDVVTTGDLYLQRQVKAGLFQPLDKNKLPLLSTLAPEFVKLVNHHDHGLVYSIPYAMWTTGVAYNADELHKRLPNTTLDSWNTLFDPYYLSRFKDCGITFLDSGNDVIPAALLYLKKNPDSENPQDYEAVKSLLTSIRPYISAFDASSYWGKLDSGQVCLAMSWSGDIASIKKTNIEYYLPKEGALAGVDVLVIPKNAQNVEGAYQLLNFIMEPKVAADFVNTVGYPTSVLPARQFIDPQYVSSRKVYPDKKQFASLHVGKVLPLNILRLRYRIWSEFVKDK